MLTKIHKNILYPILVVIIHLWQPLYAEEKEVVHTDLPHYYFAYGSNLSYDFLKERLKNGQWLDGWHKDGELEGSIPFELGVYELSDYEFSYSLDAEPFGDEGTAGNVIPKQGSKVYGIVYRLSDIHLAELDKGEDVPEAYARVAVDVHKCRSAIFGIHDFSEPLKVWMYVGNPKYITWEKNPDPVYVDLLVESARKHLFPPEYIEEYLNVKFLAEKLQQKAM